VKCNKCGKRDATHEDHLCDSCRFMQTMDNIAKSRE
jgi:NMD protein affecting ribosome stability and mRNA decay